MDSLGLEGFRVKGIWRLHDLGVKPSSACYELRMLQRDRVQWITAADTPSCGQKKHTRWPATTSKCWLAIVRSEKTHTLACNEFFGMQWITDAAARSDAMSDGCWYAIVRSEKTHTLARNEFFGVQMNHGCGSAIGYNEWHNPTSDATALGKKGIPILVWSFSLLHSAFVYRSIYRSIYLYVCLSINFSTNLSIELTISLSICLSVYLSIKLSLSIYISLSLSICLSVYLSICLSMSLPIYFSICLGI